MYLDKHVDISSDLQTLGLRIKYVQHRTLRVLEAKLAPLGISMIQWNALRAIDRHAEVSMHRLAVLTFNSDQAFGTLTTRMRRLGLVKRRRGAGRTTIHSLTPKGETLLQSGRALVQEVLAHTFSPLSDAECKTLSALLARLLDDDDFTTDP